MAEIYVNLNVYHHDCVLPIYAIVTQQSKLQPGCLSNKVCYYDTITILYILIVTQINGMFFKDFVHFH